VDCCGLKTTEDFVDVSPKFGILKKDNHRRTDRQTYLKSAFVLGKESELELELSEDILK
jgi:hypothetical protein